jgi:LysR family transcriptional regulator of gallate degradation
MLERCFSGLGMSTPMPVVESGDMAVIRGLLLRSEMLAVVSAHQLEREIMAGELCILPVQLHDTERAIGLTYRVGCLHTAVAQALMDAIRAVVGG